MKLAYYFTRRQFGKVLTPLKVHSELSPARLQCSRFAALAIVAIAFSATSLRAQTSLAIPNKPDSPMKQFVLLFRQSSPLSEADQKRRAEGIRAWARRQNEEGHKLDPRTLGEEKQRIGPSGKGDSTSRNDEVPLTAILFLEARDYAEAVKIAMSHPALRYGVISVEVRAWTSPLAPSPSRSGLDANNAK